VKPTSEIRTRSPHDFELLFLSSPPLPPSLQINFQKSVKFFRCSLCCRFRHAFITTTHHDLPRKKTTFCPPKVAKPPPKRPFFPLQQINKKRIPRNPFAVPGHRSARGARSRILFRRSFLYAPYALCGALLSNLTRTVLALRSPRIISFRVSPLRLGASASNLTHRRLKKAARVFPSLPICPCSVWVFPAAAMTAPARWLSYRTLFIHTLTPERTDLPKQINTCRRYISVALSVQWLNTPSVPDVIRHTALRVLDFPFPPRPTPSPSVRQALIHPPHL